MRGPDAGTPFLAVERLTKRFGGTTALRDLTFGVAQGDVFGIVGPNGAGKTTLLRILAGILEPTAGRAEVGGRPVSDPQHRARVGYLPEESPLYEEMTAADYLRFFGDLYGVPRNVSRDRANALLDRLGLADRESRRLGDLSKGMRRKVAIARSLVHDPALLLYDEPASGLDPVASAEVLAILEEERERGKTVVFSAHNLYHVERVSDHVLLLRDGAPVILGSMHDVRAAYGGTVYVVTTDVPVAGARRRDGAYEVTASDLEGVRLVEASAAAAGGRLIEVRAREPSLEEIFLREAAP